LLTIIFVINLNNEARSHQ